MVGGLGLDSMVGGLAHDGQTVGLGLDASAVGLGLLLDSMVGGLGHDAFGGLGLDALALGLDSTCNLRIGPDVPASGLSVGLDVSSGPTLRLGSSIVPSHVSLGNLEGNRFSTQEQTTGRDDRQKRPQEDTHRIWVEVKPMDCVFHVSYRETIVGLRLGRSGLMLLGTSFDLTLCQ